MTFLAMIQFNVCPTGSQIIGKVFVLLSESGAIGRHESVAWVKIFKREKYSNLCLKHITKRLLRIS